jgi:(2Fe-2S) ferredoxin
MVFDVHIFICCNKRGSNEKLSCGEAHGLALVAEFKKQLKILNDLNNLNPPVKFRANRSGCLGICDFGPTIAIYPEGIFYVGVQINDVSEIVQSHIVNKVPVERLLLKEKNVG